jgi:hypothetical protein
MEELHRQGGVPQGWKFSFPKGDPKAGRDVFVKLECFQCHAVQGESFPHSSAPHSGVGPELTGMGAHHPAEYLAESILNPNAVVVTAPGYTDAAGLSIMPDYRESLTVAALIDLVAYLKSLGGEPAHDATDVRQAAHAGHEMLFNQVMGDYRVRVVYQAATAGAHRHDSHGALGGAAAEEPKPAHLMAFISDLMTGQPVPYLPVTLTIPSPPQAVRTVKLIPTMGGEGFHYAAEVTLPQQPTTVTLSIGPTSMQVGPSAAGRYRQPQEVSFHWTPPRSAEPNREQPHGHGAHGTAQGH